MDNKNPIKCYPYGHLGASHCGKIITTNIKPHEGETWDNVTCPDCKDIKNDIISNEVKKRIKKNARYMR